MRSEPAAPRALIPPGGRSLTAIAGELAVSKQACSQLANLVESAGTLERRPNLDGSAEGSGDAVCLAEILETRVGSTAT